MKKYTIMNNLKVEELISNYWSCETTPEEEAFLRDFFLQEELPANLAKYKSLFVYQKQQTEMHVSATFEEKVLASIENERSVALSPKKRSLQKFMQIAAVALLMLTVGVTAYLLNDKEEYQFNYADTYSSPEEAYSVIHTAMYALSTNLNEGQKESVEALSGLDVFFEYLMVDESSASE